jgi:DNA-binding CsgD family transcriptional regulator
MHGRLNYMEQLPKSLLEYISLSSSENVKDLTKPLEAHLGITYFLFVKEYKNGRRCWLTNNGAWTEHFYQKSYYEISAFENPNDYRVPGIYLWECLKGQKVFKDARDNFNIDHGITITENYSDHAEFFHFGTLRDNHPIKNLYSENIQALKLFINYFKDQATDLIKSTEKHSVHVPVPTTNQLLENKNTTLTGDQLSLFLETITPKRYYIADDPQNVYLTPKEVECVKWSIKGKSCEEIALITGISKRTAEAHLENVKKKLNCYKQFQLGYKLGKSKLF